MWRHVFIISVWPHSNSEREAQQEKWLLSYSIRITPTTLCSRYVINVYKKKHKNLLDVITHLCCSNTSPTRVSSTNSIWRTRSNFTHKMTSFPFTSSPWTRILASSSTTCVAMLVARVWLKILTYLFFLTIKIPNSYSVFSSHHNDNNHYNHDHPSTSPTLVHRRRALHQLPGSQHSNGSASLALWRHLPKPPLWRPLQHSHAHGQEIDPAHLEVRQLPTPASLQVISTHTRHNFPLELHNDTS